MPQSEQRTDGLSCFHPTVQRWFLQAFEGPTPIQLQSWPRIASGQNVLLLAPTGSGKTLAAFLVAIQRLMFPPADAKRSPGVRVLYISPLKALGVDVERNLRSPLAGVRVAAEQEAVPHHVPSIGIRSGDTPAAERHRLNREPPEILITTPESLYLLLTSRAREILRTVDTVIVDEIHSMVANKRGSHLFLSLERLEELRRGTDETVTALQRIGLSATQRPLEEIARLLGGGTATPDPDRPPVARPVEIVQAGTGKQLELTIEVPVEDMARLSEPVYESGPAAAGPTLPSIWPAIHPRLVALIREHRATMIFVNSRRLAERLAAAVNETAGEELALAHHGSLAKDARAQIEDRLKRGQLPAIVATSSLELGIDMGAVDLVIQIEAPPSIAAGIQRVGRSGHQVGAASRGVVFPKYRGDLLACSAAAERMMAGQVEATYYPRNPLDVLAQQIVAMVALEPLSVDRLFQTARQAAPFFDLPRGAFESVLDLLSGRYPSDDFAELRPRVTWDRVSGTVSPRTGTQRIAVLNAGTIPDRGLYGVFLTDEGQGRGSRVGELDEEMVFETYPGDVFLLGASSWRVLDITNDRVLVAPAPGEPGKMPFWKGDGPGRPLEFGQAIGKLARQLIRMPESQAEQRLTAHHGLDRRAARNLMDYLRQQAEATGDVPSDRTIVVECFLDEVGDWRVVILSPYGARVHAPWAAAITGRLQEETSGEVDSVSSDDGIVFRLPESDRPPPLESLFPAPDDIEELVVRQLGSTALFAARFRENAARALLLPRRAPGKRTPLWLQRRRSADLLQVASRYPEFPILLETYRECLRDVFDLRGLAHLLQQVQSRQIHVRLVESTTASPFAASLLFSYVGKFIYDGDAPLAERRAQTLSLDYAQLRELLGDAELRELLDTAAIDQTAMELQRLEPNRHVKHADALHEMLLQIGDLTQDEIAARCVSAAVAAGEPPTWLDGLVATRRVIPIGIAGQTRYIAAEDAARYRDALGCVPPPGLPEAFLATVDDALGDLVSRYARTHTPFVLDAVAARFGIGVGPVRDALQRLASRNRVIEGEFLPGGRGREWCDTEVMRILKRRSLARLRREVEPVSQSALARFLVQWQGVQRPRRGLDGLLDVIEQLQGTALPASVLEREILPARVVDYAPSDLDELSAAGEIVWRGIESTGASSGRIAVYLTDRYPDLAPDPVPVECELADRIRDWMRQRGAVFFHQLEAAVGGFRNDLLDALWRLVWSGEVTNDTLAPLRSLQRQQRSSASRGRSGRRGFRSRRASRLPGSEGRWSLLPTNLADAVSNTQRRAALAAQLVERYGVLTREMVAAENIPGGFAGLYPVLKAMEESGKLRRGYFVVGMGAAQFAAQGAEQQLRDCGKPEENTDPLEHEESGLDLGTSPPSAGRLPPQTMVLAAADPANPYGAAIRWPERQAEGLRPQRTAGARVILHRGELLGYLNRAGQHLLTFPCEEPSRQAAARHVLVATLVAMAEPGRPTLIAQIDGASPAESPLGPLLTEAGFTATTRGYLHRGKPVD